MNNDSTLEAELNAFSPRAPYLVGKVMSGLRTVVFYLSLAFTGLVLLGAAAWSLGAWFEVWPTWLEVRHGQAGCYLGDRLIFFIECEGFRSAGICGFFLGYWLWLVQSPFLIALGPLGLITLLVSWSPIAIASIASTRWTLRSLRRRRQCKTQQDSLKRIVES